MSDSNQDMAVEALFGQIDAGLEVLARIAQHLERFLATEGNAMGRSNVAAVVVAANWKRGNTEKMRRQKEIEEQTNKPFCIPSACLSVKHDKTYSGDGHAGRWI